MVHSSIYYSEEFDSTLKLGIRLFCDEASSTYYCGTDQCHATCDDACGSYAGVLLAIISFAMLSRSGRKEGIDFKHNRWIFFLVMAAVLGAVSGLYDKFLMAPVENGGVGLDRMEVQSWYNFYQMLMMGTVLIIAWKKPFAKFRGGKPLFPQSAFHWNWAIIFISVFLSAADFVYFYALSLPGAMISIVSMIRRGSVIVSFLFGAAIFHEKNLKTKVVDLALVLLGMVFLYIGSH